MRNSERKKMGIIVDMNSRVETNVKYNNMTQQGHKENNESQCW